MTNKEILHTDLLDILFEHRNKAYGAYMLRRQYNRRLVTALVMALSVLLAFIFFRAWVSESIANNKRKPGEESSVKLISLPPEKPDTPEEPRPQKKNQFKQVHSTNKIQIVDNNQKTNVPDQKDIAQAIIGTEDIDGNIPGDPNRVIPASDADEKAKNEKDNPAPPVTRGETVMPAFPGGQDALSHFLSNHLITPDDLEPGQKVTVLVKFLISTDGSISACEIVQSGGKLFDKEVIRVIKKMPRWNPGKQNGHPISMYFTQPVTFIGVEE